MFVKKGVKILSAILFAMFICSSVYADDEVVQRQCSTYQTPKAEFVSYMSDLKNRIQKNWNPPDYVEEGHVSIIFKLDKEGNLLSSEITKSSGDAVYDESIINALHKSAPFSKFPENSSRDSLTIKYSFESSIVKTESIKEIVNKAERLYNINNKMALAYINQAIDQVHGDCGSYFLYAKRHKIYKALGNIQAAEEDMAECKRLKALYDKKRIATCKKAVETVNDAFSYFYLANAYDIAGEYNNAINAIDKAISMTPLNHAYKRYKIEIIEKHNQ